MARIFLLGCSRSGTTALQRCLASHPDAHSFPETGFFRQLGGNRFWTALALRGIVRRKAVQRAFGRLGTVVPELVDHASSTPPLFTDTRQAVDRFVQMMDCHVADQGKTLWVEKTPKHYQYAWLIQRYIPDVRIIHVIRNGRDVVASIRDRAERYPERFAAQADPAYGVREWNRAVAMAWAQRLEKRVRLVLFDDFTASPEDHLRDLAQWTHVPYTGDMLTGGSRASIRHAHEHWKDSAQSPIQTPESKFATVFSSREKSWIEENLDWETYNRLTDYTRQQHPHLAPDRTSQPDTSPSRKRRTASGT